MPDYAALSATALRLLQSFGGTFPMRHRAGDTHDPVTGSLAGGDWAEQPAWAVFTPPSGPADQYAGVTLAPELIRDVVIAGAGLDWPPAPLDQIYYHGDWWTLRGVTELAPDGATTLIWRGWAVAP